VSAVGGLTAFRWMRAIAFARHDSNRHVVLSRRNRANIKRIDGAVGVVGFVEIHHHFAVLRKLRFEKPPGPVCFMAGGPSQRPACPSKLEGATLGK